MTEVNNVIGSKTHENMKISYLKNPNLRIVSIEDGIDNLGFRKFSAYVKQIHPNTEVLYVPTGNLRNVIKVWSEKEARNLSDEQIHSVAKYIAKGDIIGFSSMTQYSNIVYRIISKIRKLNPSAYIIWGGIHPIVEPEDAIKHADAICTGEGEFAFKIFLELFKNGKDYTTTPSFWFKQNSTIIKNRNLPLMKSEEMDKLPPLTYEDGELIYQTGKGFKKIDYNDFIRYTGLGYNAIWTIGCPLHCSFCANTKFIEYDSNYRKLRHSSPQTMINEVKRVVSKHPHISTVSFYDDSFLNLPYAKLEEFCNLWKKEVNIPFVVLGIVPNYVREEKIAILVDAGMNRLRMGIQSGSENILEFYRRPTKLNRIKEATEIFYKFRKYILPPIYDIILENPVEATEDTRATVDMLYEMPRPYTLNIFALRVIPNTTLAKDIKDKGIHVPEITKSFYVDYHRTMGTCLVFALTFWKIPRWLYKILRNKIYPAHMKQPHYPIFYWFCRTGYFMRRGFDHIRFMDFSLIPGKPGYYLWKFGVISFWRRFVLKSYTLPKDKQKKAVKV